MHDNINIAVGGPINADYPKVYKTKFLKPGIPVSLQVTEPNTKYVIKYNFDLDGGTVTIPEGCLLEFDGGSISNGTIEFDNTILIYNQQEEDVLKNITMVGDYEVSAGGKGDKKNNINGMGKIYLKKNKGFAEQLTQENTIYVIQYDFTLDEDITIPANCILEFDGGSLNGAHTLTGNNTAIQAGLVKIFNTNITLVGTWNVIKAYPEWFGAKGDGVTNDRISIQKAIDSFDNIYGQSNKTYVVSCSASQHCLTIDRDGQSLIINLLDTDIYDTTDYRGRSIIFCDNKNKFTYKGNISSVNNSIPVGSTNGPNLEFYARSAILCSGDCKYFDINLNCQNLYAGIMSGSIYANAYKNGTVGLAYGKINVNAYRISYAVATASCNYNEINVIGDSMHRIVWMHGDYNKINACGKNYYGSGASHIILFSNLLLENEIPVIKSSNFNEITYKQIKGGINFDNEVPYVMINPISENEGTAPEYTHEDYGFYGNVFNLYSTKEDTVIGGMQYLYKGPLSTWSYDKTVTIDAVINIYGDISRASTVELYGITKNNLTINNYTLGSFRFILEDDITGSAYNFNGNIKARVKDTKGVMNIKGTDVSFSLTQVSTEPIEGDILISSLKPSITITAERNRKKVKVNTIDVYTTRNVAAGSPDTTIPFISYFDQTYKKRANWTGTIWADYDGVNITTLRSGTFAQKPVDFNIYVGFKYFCTDRKVDMDSSSQTYMQIITPVSPDTGGMEIIHKGNNVWVDALGRVVS